MNLDFWKQLSLGEKVLFLLATGIVTWLLGAISLLISDAILNDTTAFIIALTFPLICGMLIVVICGIIIHFIQANVDRP